MKRMIATLLSLLILLSGCNFAVTDATPLPPMEESLPTNSEGCSSVVTDNGMLLKEGTVKSITVTSLPGNSEYYFTDDDAAAIVEYISELNLSIDFAENPGEYDGRVWEISIEYENGVTQMIHHSGNMFIRTETGPWYKMLYEEASIFGTLLYELREKNPSVKLIRYDWSGRGLSRKTIQPGEMATNLAQMLNAMEENGQIVPKISDDSLDDYSINLPVERGTMWIEIGTDLYRITPGFTQLCRVDSHFGAGYVLDMSPEFAALLVEAWQYFPFNYYSGTYDSETNEITLDHKREAPSTVQIQIKSLEVYDSFNPHNKIVLEVTSTIDQTVPIEISCQQSDDNLGLGDYKELTLTRDQSQTVELSFIGFDVQHWIEIKAGNTFIYLTIIP